MKKGVHRSQDWWRARRVTAGHQERINSKKMKVNVISERRTMVCQSKTRNRKWMSYLENEV